MLPASGAPDHWTPLSLWTTRILAILAPTFIRNFAPMTMVQTVNSCSLWLMFATFELHWWYKRYTNRLNLYNVFLIAVMLLKSPTVMLSRCLLFIHDGGSRHVREQGDQLRLFVCLSDRDIKGKRHRHGASSRPVAVARHALTLRSKGQRTRSRGH